jgi:hypothetical protein
MFPSFSCKALLRFALVGFGLATPSYAAVAIQFGSETWDHSAFGGPSSSNGWSTAAASSTIPGGSTVLVDGGTSVEVTIALDSFGSTVSSHSFFHSGSGNRLSTSSDFNGSAPNTSPALVIANKNDKDLGTSTLSTYSKVTFSFSKPVILSKFILGDIDHRTDWQDMVGISSLIGGQSVGNSIITGAAGYHEVLPERTYGGLFPAGTISAEISGVNDSPGSADNALAQVVFDSFVDTVSIYFWNTGTTGAEHAIFVKSGDIEVSEIVPEPTTLVLGVLGLGFFGFRRLR